MKNQRLRIVNKSKDGITIDFKGELGLKKSTWDEFNKMYIICKDDKRYCILNPEWEKRMSEAKKMIDDCMIYYLQVDWKIADPNQVPDLVHMGIVGEYAKKISELMECSYIEAISLINYQALQIRNAFGGRGFKGLGANKLKNNKKNPTAPRKDPDILTNKISDFNPDLEKLRDQLKEQEKEK